MTLRRAGRARRPAGRLIVAAGLALASIGPPASAAGSPWPEIGAAEKALRQVPFDPDAGAVILVDSRDGSIVAKGSDFANVLTYHRRLKILNERGRESGEVRIPAGKFSRVEQIEARTVRPDGSVIAVPSSEIHERIVARTRGFSEIAYVFHFPSVEPGAILEYRYQRTVDAFVFIEPWSFTQPLPVLLSRVTQAIPGGADYAVACHRCPDAKPVVTPFRDGQKRGTRHTWEVRDVKALRDEPLSPPDRVRGTVLELVLRGWYGFFWPQLDRDDRFFTDWDSVGRFASWGYEWAAKEDAGALKSAVAGWIAGVKEPEARLEAVIAGARRATRYLGGEEVYGHSRPVGDLMRDGTADNEERAVLMAAALRIADFPARIALVAGRDAGPLYQNFPSLTPFSFAVVLATLPDGTEQWIDPTLTWASGDFLSWRASGAPALLLDKRRKNPLVVLPTLIDTGMTRFDVKAAPGGGGRTTLQVEVTMLGEPAVEMREMLAPAGGGEREDRVREWLESLAPPMPIESLAIEGLEEIGKPLRMRFTAEAAGLTLVADEALGMRACIFDCLDGRPLLSGERSAPFFVDRGERHLQVVTFAPPAGRVATGVPGMEEASSPIGVYSFGCAKQESGEVECLRALTLPRARLPASDGAAVRAMLRKAAEMDRRGVTFEPSAGAPPTGGR